MSRKGENIFKRKDGRWEARYIHHYENGQAKYRYVYAPTYAEAKARKLIAQTGAPEEQVSPAKQLCTFGTLSELWLADIKSSVRESTFTRYHRIVEKYLLPQLGEQQLVKIDQKHLNSLPPFPENDFRYPLCAEIDPPVREKGRLCRAKRGFAALYAKKRKAVGNRV